MSATKVKTSRKSNWQVNEVSVLVNGCTDNVSTIYGRHGDTSEKEKGQFWRDICERINSIGGLDRLVEEVMKKWKDLKSQTKKKEQIRRKEMGKTGGGGAVNSLRDWEEKIISVIPSAVIDGLNDGQDIFKKNAEGLGSVLLQEFDEKKLPVAYASRKLLPREQKYLVIEKECLAKFHRYLFGKDFILETDYQPLIYLNKAKLSNSRLMRWALALQPYRTSIRAIPGRENVGADYLSRV